MMKTIKLSALAIILGGFALSFSACGNNEENEDKTESTSATNEVSPADTTKVKDKGFAPTINIRYVDLDRIYTEYTYAAQELAKVQKMGVELQQYQNTLAANIQKKGNDIQQKMNNNGYLSQQSYEADMKDFNQLQQSAEQQYAARLQKNQAEAQKITAAVDEAINNYIIKFNEKYKYDAILPKAVGIYFNPALDITDEIIDGLNGALTTAKAAPAAETK